MDFKVGEYVIIVRPMGRGALPLVPKGTKVKVVGFTGKNKDIVIEFPEKYEGQGFPWIEGYSRKLYYSPLKRDICKLTECKHCGIEVGIGKCIYCGYENGGENGF